MPAAATAKLALNPASRRVVRAQPNPGWPTRSPNSASSSSATAISWPTATTRSGRAVFNRAVSLRTPGAPTANPPEALVAESACAGAAGRGRGEPGAHALGAPR